MEDYKYYVVDARTGETLATGMRFDMAEVFMEGYLARFYNEPELVFTIGRITSNKIKVDENVSPLDKFFDVE